MYFKEGISTIQKKKKQTKSLYSPPRLQNGIIMPNTCHFKENGSSPLKRKYLNSQIYTVGNVVIEPLSADNMVQLMYLSMSWLYHKPLFPFKTARDLEKNLSVSHCGNLINISHCGAEIRRKKGTLNIFCSMLLYSTLFN